MSKFANELAFSAARVASVLGPSVMRVVAVVNKYVTNPALERWASRARHLAVIEHRGRKSGRHYATPVMAFVEVGAISVVLNYGAQSDWVRNVTTARSAIVVHRRSRYALTDPRIVPIDSSELPASVRGVGDSSRLALRAKLNPA